VSSPAQTPFDSVEGAQQYIRLLLEAIIEGKHDIQHDLQAATRAKSDRRVEALRLVEFKLNKLEQLLHSSGRLLNDLRTLRRLLLEERVELAPSNYQGMLEANSRPTK
jgi:hypothetical protein